MATIVLSDAAPKDAKSFSLANENFEVPFETTDAGVLSNARAHPWLKVEQDPELDAAQDSENPFEEISPADDTPEVAPKSSYRTTSTEKDND